MSAMIETSEVTGKAEMAYAGAVPWHGLGQDLSAGAPLEVWREEAGLNFDVLAAKVKYETEDGQLFQMDQRKVLFRSDTHKPLGVVGEKYRIVQPGEAIEFFRDLTEERGFTMETAGVLGGGQRIWALARMGSGADVITTDRTTPYVLLATSFDGGLATTVKRTAIRVVCHNTITMALNQKSRQEVRVHHGAQFDSGAVKQELGLVQSAWDAWLKQAKRLSEIQPTAEQVDELTRMVALRTIPKTADADAQRDSKAYKKVLDLFNGAAIGSDLTQGPTAWQWLNSVTEYVDHHKGRSPDSRMKRAWFGDGDATKSAAWDALTEMFA